MPSVRRQARGERRITDILDATLALFAELGYEKTSTNAIAARAGMSPGSLYQYFPNKEAIAEALSQRLVDELRAAHAAAFGEADVMGMPLPDLISRVVDPLVAFNVTHPGAKALLGNTAMPAALAAGSRPLQSAVTGRVAAIIRARSPHLPDADADRAAMVAVQIVAALMGPIVIAEGDERAALITELKRALTGYLQPLTE
ncbi:TetR family transcriptional regulator [Paractinoplanes abujensis]|uniref:AcrR family transcriptional regulator n=1 Tax=Paractinoplanes abujensis TaxID=882441 RepID=A0A7W7CM69_9ACTN|nr:TetR/AcrR family transcriptional regulator [Actinoplanes abujensis]MBB4691122.1 AcrR family transcriptional regulator [Actinoplanes abujensis]GID17464.1 TetR family transcriptional regulator [Actinoplanes abujensis]